MKYIMVFLFSVPVLAAVSNEVLIQGVISGTFNDSEVKITDSLGQTYFLPKKLLPKGQKVAQGEKFAIEVSEADVKNLKLIKR